MKTNVIYCGDCKDVLTSDIEPESVDLIYLDPPFFTNKNQEIIWKDGAEKRSFNDRWEGGINHFTNWMEKRLEACRDSLKRTGSVYLHCDWRATHYLRMTMDRVFGSDNFKNTIIWHFGLGGGPRDHWNRKHHDIHFYTRSKKFGFNMQYVPATSQKMKGQMKKMDDVWDIPSINNMSRERLGYPTQKPELLLERIVHASSSKGDLVLDPFCGCGTAIAVAHKNDRRWIGVDISPVACRVMGDRMKGLEGIIDVEIIGLPLTIGELRESDPFKFQEYICRKLKGMSSDKKSGDMGIDGYTLDGKIPIQVKRSDKVGRNVVDNFETAIERKGKNVGMIIGFSFSRSAYDEVARVKREKGMEIRLVKVSELL